MWKLWLKDKVAAKTRLQTTRQTLLKNQINARLKQTQRTIPTVQNVCSENLRQARAGYVVSPEDLHGLSYYIRRAEDLLAGLTDTKESLTSDDRAMLERHLARAREIATKPEPLTISEKRALYTFVEIVGALGPRLQSLRNRAKGDWQAEIKAASNRATAKARAALAKQTDDEAVNVIIAEEDKPGLKRNTLLGRVNVRLTAAGGSAITYEALRARQKRKKKRSP